MFQSRPYCKLAKPFVYRSAHRSMWTIDLHAGGEPARVVVGGFPCAKGITMHEKRKYIMENADHLRKVLLLEPRGYPCQNANVIFPSTMKNAKYGYVIMEQNKIYPMMSGHNTICVATAILESGMEPMPEGGNGEVCFELESPGGIVPIRASCLNGKVKSITLRNVPSFVVHKNVSVNVPEVGSVIVDVVFAGMWYCIVDTKFLISPLKLVPQNGKNICRLGEMIKTACREQYPVNHPDYDYPGCDILVFCGDQSETITPGSIAKNAVVMSNGKLDWSNPETWTGMLDRSPCGTGTSAVMAKHYFNGHLPLGQDFVHESIIGTQFVGRLIEETRVGSYAAVVPEITGSAWVTQYCHVVVDRHDPFPSGFTVGDIWA